MAILVGYWAILMFVPSPESKKAGDYTKETNLSGYLDRQYLPGRINKNYYGFGDNEGLLSTIPAVATALLGVLAGHWLLSDRGGWIKALGLAVAGLACLGLGTLWGTGLSDHQDPLDQLVRPDRGRLEPAPTGTLLHDHRRAQVPRLGVLLRRHRRQRDHDLRRATDHPLRRDRAFLLRRRRPSTRGRSGPWSCRSAPWRSSGCSCSTCTATRSSCGSDDEKEPERHAVAVSGNGPVSGRIDCG